MEASISTTPVLWLAFAVAFAFGAIGQKTHFCTMGAVSDIVNMEDWSHNDICILMWLIASLENTKWFEVSIDPDVVLFWSLTAEQVAHREQQISGNGNLLAA